ncbi:MAG: FtsX-like permease family protein, partial [Anaerolineae bacterium]|nr:FtsX-like permease family protein [Anaerolineae bacterium]
SSGRVAVRTVPDLFKQNQQIADIVGSFIVVMGLGALLIGGVGIINTMLVMVNRRTEEIAALKTFGLKGGQIGLIFITEALLLGLAGSVVGSLFGIVLSGLANAYGQTLIQQPLVFRIYPQALLFGGALGVVISAVFGVLPVVTAVKIRPAIILRPNETVIPRAGCLQSLGMIVLVTVVVGVIAGQMLTPAFATFSGYNGPNPFMIGIIGVAITLGILGLLIAILWLVVWLLGRFPTFGSVDLRLTLRNLRARRLRTATTLLALSAGMFALSSITFFGAGARQIIQFSLSEGLGGNVMIFSVLPPALSNPLIDNKLDSIEGVTSRTRYLNYSGEITAINGQQVDQQNTEQRRRALRDQIRQASRAGDFGKMTELSGQLEALLAYNVRIAVRETTGTELGPTNIIKGRTLTAEDRGQPVAVVSQSEALKTIGVDLGATITVNINGRPVDLEIVGVTPSAEEGGMQAGFQFGNLTVPPDVLTVSGQQNFQMTLADIQPEYLDAALLDLSSLPLVYSIDISFIDGLLRRFIDQFSALPILVGLLSLLAAAVIMANTVALATLERRRQIGILKAVGLKGRRVLGIMLLENVLVSLLGGMLGIGLSALGVVLMSSMGLQIAILVPAESTPWAIVLIYTAVMIGAVATLLSAQVAVNERVTNVLRYE